MIKEIGYALEDDKYNFRRKIFTNANEAEKLLNKYDNIKDKYTTIYSYIYDKEIRTKQDVKDFMTAREQLLVPCYSGIYLDLDINNIEVNFEEVKEDLIVSIDVLKKDFNIPIEYQEIYFSGNKGFHITVNPFVLGIKPDIMLHDRLKYIAFYVKSKTPHKSIDIKIYDNARLFRVPNTKNYKSGLYKIPIYYDEIDTLTYRKIKEMASAPRKKKEVIFQNMVKRTEVFDYIMSGEYGEKLESMAKAKLKSANNKVKKKIDTNNIVINLSGKGEVLVFKNGKKNIPPCIGKMLSSSAYIGERNNTAILLCSVLFQIGLKLDVVTAIVSEWNNRLDESLPDRELQTTIKSAFNQIQNNKHYGCTKIREMGYCINEQCKIYQQKIKMEGDL